MLPDESNHPSRPRHDRTTGVPHWRASTDLTPPGGGDPLAVLRAVAAARARCDARRSPLLVAELDRRLARAARAIEPPAVVARAVATSDRPLASPLVRAWLDQLLRLPPPLALLVLVRARWFLPAAAPTRRRRSSVARALLAGLRQRHPPLDRHLIAALPPGARDAALVPVIRRGLAAFVAGDTITCLHLLVPCVEALLRDRLADRPAMPPPTGARLGLPELLRRAEQQPGVGTGLAGALRDVLLAGGADGLRHRLAHGRRPAAACTRRAAQDVVLGLLRLAHAPPAPPAGTAHETAVADPARRPA